MQTDEQIREEALAWAVRTADPAFADWEAFTAWLEGDAARAEAYDRIASVASEAADALPVEMPAANDDVPTSPRFSRRWLGGAIAASLAVATLFGVWSGQGTDYTVETAPGEMRMIALDDGGMIELAGGSRIALDEDRPRFARLEYGQALFTIAHDESDPFILDAGADRLVDAGTVFDVNLRDTGLSLAVSEGAVIFNPDAQRVTVSPGEMLESAAGSDEYEVRPILPEQVGEWREGRLTFEQATIAEVAADLSRATGTSFAAGRGSARREISGSLLVGPVREDPRSLEDLLGVIVRAEGDGWVIEGR